MYEEEKDKLKSCINDYERRISNLLNVLGWTKENTLKEHKSNQSKYKEKEYEQMDPLYPDTLVAKNFVKFDSSSLQQFFSSSDKWSLPQKFSEFQIKFTREEKLILYQSVIDKTGKLTEPEVSILPINENDEGSSNKTMTFSEIVAIRRDEKRRRLKYRTTKSTPLSVTEEFRHLIEIQMQAYSQYLNHAANQSSNEKNSHQRHSSKEHKKSRHKASHKEKKHKRK